MKIAVFCSANNNISREYFERTTELARWCREEGHTIVFGGCNMGLMGCLAEEKGSLVGVVPRIIEQGGRVSENLTVHIPCDNLSDRKDLMLLHSDVVVALPGGIGTLDEIFTVAAGHTIGYHHKPIILYNINGFWDSLVALLDDLQQRGMIRGHWTDFIRTANTLEELKAML
ncbi:MAG: TIGR00730 family Rossman fold protein [Prevotella sp.]|jgi:uncharacterized protein (TIGR00730 family)|nr:TIGR00730 family Rossman fold protein [Prevotella sp.]